MTRSSLLANGGFVAAVGLLLAMLTVSIGVASADEFDTQADYVAAVDRAKGHLLAAREVYRRRQQVRAGVHASHPIQELGYRPWRPVAQVDRELGARLQAALKEPGRAVEAWVPAVEYDKVIDRTLVLLDRGVARAVAAERRAEARFQARVMQALLVAIDQEYGEAIAEGRVVLEIEYQDAWGFFQRLRARWARLTPVPVDRVAGRPEESPWRCRPSGTPVVSCLCRRQARETTPAPALAPGNPEDPETALHAPQRSAAPPDTRDALRSQLLRQALRALVVEAVARPRAALPRGSAGW